MSTSASSRDPIETEAAKPEPDSAPEAASARQVAPPPAVRIDDSQAQPCYANFCRVTGTPEELIIDFALNSQPLGIPADPLRVGQRVVVNFFTAKRLLQALQMTLQRHESAFGVLETNVQKRVQGPRS